MSRAERMRAELEAKLQPIHLEIIDESSMHSVPKGAESHFKIIVATAQFEGMNRVARHRAINQLLRDELSRGLHALTLSTFSAGEWASAPAVHASPACLGGSKADAK